MMIYKYILIILLCLNFGCSQNNSTTSPQDELQDDSQDIEKRSVLTTFTKEEYLEDLNQLIQLLNDNHPQLHEYVSERELANILNEKIALLDDNFKIGEFIWLCRSLIAEIGCGHTVFPTLGMNYFLPDSLRFPLEVNYLDEKLYVLNPLANKDLISAGDEIISINGVNVKKIKEELYKHISSDANNGSLKMEFVNDGFMEYAAFHFKFIDKYEIEFIKDNKIETVTLNQINEYKEDEIVQGKCRNNLCFETDENLAVITIRSFYYYRENFDTFKSFIDSCFNEIKNEQIENLIIDLRDNGGGDPYCGSYLLQHIADKPYQYYKIGTYSYSDLQINISPHKNGFSGKPIILINGRCFSTTGQLCALIKANNFGVFVGRETGATFRCNATVRPFALTNTNTSPYIATRTFEANVSTLPKDRGIIPNYEPEMNISDLLNNKDVDLEFSINLLRSKE